MAQQIILDIPDGYEFFYIGDGKVVCKKKELVLPKTWDECVMTFEEADFINITNDVHKLVHDDIRSTQDYWNVVPCGMGKAMLALSRLLICRDAWWKALEYKPDWLNKEDIKHCIHLNDGYIGITTHSKFPRILAFPSYEAASEFRNTFCELIEEAKELL